MAANVSHTHGARLTQNSNFGMFINELAPKSHRPNTERGHDEQFKSQQWSFLIPLLKNVIASGLVTVTREQQIHGSTNKLAG